MLCRSTRFLNRLRRLMVQMSLICCCVLCLSGVVNAKNLTYSLQSAKGRVEIQVEGKGAWTPLKRGVQDAAVGDHIRTGPNGAVHIITDDGVRLALGPNTEVILREQNKPRGWRLLVGKLLAVFAKADGGEVRAPGAIAAAEGTTFQVEVAADGTTELTVIEGEVRFFNDQGSVQVQDSQQSIARVGQAPTRPIAIDPSSLMAWEANLQTVLFEVEYLLTSADPVQLEQQLQRQQAVLQQQPQDPTAHATLAAILLDMNRTEEALAHAQQAVDADPRNGGYHGILGYALLKNGYPAEALSQLELAAAAEPDNSRWKIGLALNTLGQRNVKPAVMLLQRAVELAPGDPLPLAYLTVAYLRTGELEKAAVSATQAIGLNPNHYLANAYLAYVRLAQGQADEALSAASKAVQQAPHSALAHEALGSVLFFTGNFPVARQEIEQSLAINPLSASAHLTLAKLLAAQDEIEPALQQAEQAVALNPQSAPARSTLGLLFLLSNDPHRAERQFAQALVVDPSLAEARTGWGQVLLRRGRFHEALDQQKAAVSLDTDSASAQNNLGGVYASLGQTDLAIQYLTRASEMQPGWGLPYANLALVYLELNRFRDALTAAERALALGERSAFVHTVLARIYIRQGRSDRALTELRQALVLNPDYPQARFQLAQLYLGQNRSRDAVREILLAVATDPSAMLEQRRYARTEGTLATGSNQSIEGTARHSDQAMDGRLSFFSSGLLSDTDGYRPVNQDRQEKFLEIIAGHQSSPARQFIVFSTLLDHAGGLPGPESDSSAGDPDDHQEFTGYDTVLAYRQRLSPTVTGIAKYTIRKSHLDFENIDSLLGDDSNPFRNLDYDNTGHSVEFRTTADLRNNTSLQLGYGHLWETPEYEGTVGLYNSGTGDFDFIPFALRSPSQTGTAWIEARRSLTERLELTLGEYWGRETDAAGVLQPKVTAVYRPDAATWWALIVNPIFRSDALELAPVEALADPFGLDYLDFIEGGYGRSHELRFQRQGRRANTFTTAVAYQTVRGLLIDVQDPDLTGLPTRTQADRGHRWVAETMYEQWLTNTVSGRAWVRWQDSNGDFTAEQAVDAEWPYTPEWQGGVRLDYITAKGYRIGLSVYRIGSRFDDPANEQRVAGYTLANMRVQYQHDLQHNYFVDLINLTDVTAESYAGFPLPGRTFRAGLDYRF